MLISAEDNTSIDFVDMQNELINNNIELRTSS